MRSARSDPRSHWAPALLRSLEAGELDSREIDVESGPIAAVARKASGTMADRSIIPFVGITGFCNHNVATAQEKCITQSLSVTTPGVLNFNPTSC